MTGRSNPPARDVLTRIDELPAPRAAANALRLKAFRDQVASRGKITLAELASAGAFSDKTLRKHIRSGDLPAHKDRVDGKLMWLIEPHDAATYLERSHEILRVAVHEKRNRPVRTAPPPGYLSIEDVATRCDVSHWTVRQHLANAGVETTLGRHGAKLIAAAEVPRLAAYFAPLRKASGYKPRPQAPEPRQPVTAGPYFDDFAVIFAVMRAQPEISAADMAMAAGARERAGQRWKEGSRVPREPEYRARLIRLFREVFPCRLSRELETLADDHLPASEAQ